MRGLEMSGYSVAALEAGDQAPTSGDNPMRTTVLLISTLCVALFCLSRPARSWQKGDAGAQDELAKTLKAQQEEKKKILAERIGKYEYPGARNPLPEFIILNGELCEYQATYYTTDNEEKVYQWYTETVLKQKRPLEVTNPVQHLYPGGQAITYDNYVEDPKGKGLACVKVIVQEAEDHIWTVVIHWARGGKETKIGLTYVPRVAFVEADALAWRFATKPEAAEKKYGGKRVQLTGTVEAIGRKGEYAYLHLAGFGEGKSKVVVECGIDRSEAGSEEALQKLKQGDSVRLQGLVDYTPGKDGQGGKVGIARSKFVGDR